MLAAILLCGVTTFTSCGDDDKNTVNTQQKEYFTQWNQCEALTALKEYVADVTNTESKNYIPKETPHRYVRYGRYTRRRVVSDVF